LNVIFFFVKNYLFYQLFFNNIPCFHPNMCTNFTILCQFKMLSTFNCTFSSNNFLQIFIKTYKKSIVMKNVKLWLLFVCTIPWKHLKGEYLCTRFHLETSLSFISKVVVCFNSCATYINGGNCWWSSSWK
jgi:hypothetical protein